MDRLDLLRHLDRVIAGEPAVATWREVLVDPAASLCVRGGRAWRRDRGGEWRRVEGHAWELLRALQREGGTTVFLASYDAGRLIEKIPTFAEDDLGIPELLAFRFDARSAEEISSRPSSIVPRPPPSVGPVEARTSPKDFEAMVLRAKRHIGAGDVFQVNLSHRLSCATSGDPIALFARLCEVNPAPFACYLQSGGLPDDAEGFEILSSSPERLFLLDGDRLEARPIAGTRPREADPRELLEDPKERAEHVMLVDLARNDLGRVARYGSVHVPALLTVESYRTVHHLVSVVEARLAQGRDAVDALVAMFPGGTITGAPKVRSMEIIEEIEPVRRGPYTGSLGWIDERGADANILIRTLVRRRGRLYLNVGAGIVEDSDPAREYAETLAKAKGVLLALAPEVRA